MELRKSSREFDLFVLLRFFRFCLIPRLSIVRGAPRTDFAFVRNFYRASGIEIIDDGEYEM